MSSNTSNDHDIVLEANCRQTWPTWTCICGNVCGLSSTTLWFLVLLPQVWKNFRRKSVQGLSVLWATANFTASLVNLFFVFKYAKIPLYGQISSVYCPILEFTLIIQFWVYGEYRQRDKMVYGCVCLLLWVTVLVVEFLTTVQSPLEYVAIVLWCVETFPQVILNMRLQSTSGQSLGSVMIAMVGKTTDFCSNNILVIPIHYVIMTYFSSSVAYINGIQVAWYYGNELDCRKRLKGDATDEGGVSGISNVNFTHSQQSVDSINSSEYSQSSRKTDNSTGVQRSSARTETIPKMLKDKLENLTVVDFLRFASMTLLSSLLISFVVGFVWNVGSLFGLFAPVAIVVVLSSAKLFLDKCDM